MHAASNLARQMPERLDPATAARLLIVDDIADNLIVLGRRFVRQGYEIVEASSGQEALALLAAQRFDAVLLDVMMPGMDGLETLGRIRALHAAAELPVIMVTARSQSDDVVAALTLGANDYITKPVDFQVALARVGNHVERMRAQAAALHAANDLKALNDKLEQRVNERTRALRETAERLQGEIAERERSEAENRYLARHDMLTGLGNRLLFHERLAEAVAQAQEGRLGGDGVTVLFVDLDGFKSVNDGLGHAIGDQVLRQVAERLRHEVGEGGLVARLGGDEFAVMLTGAGRERIVALSERLIGRLSRIFDIGGDPVQIGASIGFASSAEGGADVDSLLKRADMAMYRAKSEGRGVWRGFDAEMDAGMQSRRLLERDLRKALSDGELALFYQPLVDLKTKRITGFEALMRWRHTQRGYISPAEFIPVAEDLGLIVPLGEWALRQACLEACKWPEDVRIAVNLSPVQFSRGNLVATVMSALGASGLAATRLELEITEGVLLENSLRNVEILSQLRLLGVRIAIDDFGTGYSSLGYLRSFPFDKIKIDQSFIRDIAVNPESQAIVAAIMGLGSQFGITTTAEGVETDAQAAQLSENGCTEVQGRLFSMPVPADAIAGLLVESHGKPKG